jgi:hypothetical protein
VVPSAFTTRAAAGPAPVISSLPFLAAPHRARILESISTSGQAIPVSLHHCQTSSSQRTEGILGNFHTRQRPSAPAIFSRGIGLHWPLCRRACRGVYIHPPAKLRAFPNHPIRNVTPSPAGPVSFLDCLSIHVLPAPFPTSIALVVHQSSQLTHPNPTNPRHVIVAASSCCARPHPGPIPRQQTGKLRDSTSIALGVSGSRTSLQSAAQEPAGWDGQWSWQKHFRLREPARHAPSTISRGKRFRPLQAGALDCGRTCHLGHVVRWQSRCFLWVWLRLRRRCTVRIVAAVVERFVWLPGLRHWPAAVAATCAPAVFALRPKRHVRCSWRARLSIRVLAV